MDPKVAKVLATRDQSREVADLASRCSDLLRLSRDEMKKYYTTWDRHDQVYRGEVNPDETDAKANARGEPVKMIVPLTFQQVQTYVAFAYQVLTQRAYFYELEGVGLDDVRPAAIGQAILEHDLAHNKYTSVQLVQLLTNYAKYGLAVQKHSWEHRTVPIIEEVSDPAFQQTPGMAPVQAPTITQVRDVTKHLGNKIQVVSNYQFFPDPRIPITRCDEGEFIATTDEYSYAELEFMEQQGLIAGLEHVPRHVDPNELADRRLQFVKNDITTSLEPQYCAVDEFQIKLNPARTMYDNGKPLNKNIDREVIYIVWMANGKRIIRLEPMGYVHQEFTIDAVQFYPDQDHFINDGIAGAISALQDAVTWFINARITNVRKVISNQLVVDPSAIEFQDLKERSPIIRLKKAFAGTGIDQYIKQLQVQDVTTNHLNDANYLADFAKEVTGINDNLLGNYAPGRRSAQESRSVNTAAASRLLVTVAGFWECLALPQGRKMLSNLRQGLDEQVLVNVIGIQSLQANPSAGAFLYVTKDQLIGNYDFLYFDGALPSERGYTAQVLDGVLQLLAKDKSLVFALGLDPKLLLLEQLELRNVRNPERFALTPDRFKYLAVLAGIAANPGMAVNALTGGLPVGGGNPAAAQPQPSA
jgi:hypothetical protein